MFSPSSTNSYLLLGTIALVDGGTLKQRLPRKLRALLSFVISRPRKVVPNRDVIITPCNHHELAFDALHLV